jgi:hypothetical protein
VLTLAVAEFAERSSLEIVTPRALWSGARSKTVLFLVSRRRLSRRAFSMICENPIRAVSGHKTRHILETPA